MPDCFANWPALVSSVGAVRVFYKGFFESFEVGAQAIDFRLEPDNGNGLHGLLFQHLLRDREQRFLIFQTTGDEIRFDRTLGNARKSANKISDPLHEARKERPPAKGDAAAFAFG